MAIVVGGVVTSLRSRDGGSPASTRPRVARGPHVLGELCLRACRTAGPQGVADAGTVAGMTPPPLSLARRIAPLLEDIPWGIGGSVLLHHLGLEPAPSDLDVVTTVDAFPVVRDRLAGVLAVRAPKPHRNYLSAGFVRLADEQGVVVEVMAGIAVVDGGIRRAWEFRPGTVERVDGLPWMSAQDWLALYRLFDRPARVALLQRYLQRA